MPRSQIPDFPLPPGGLRLKVPGVRLRPCRRDDLPFLLRLYRQIREDEFRRLDWPETMRGAFCADQFAAQHRHYVAHFPQAHFLVMMADGQPVGRLTVDVGEEAVRLVDLAIIAGRRGQGLGTAVLRALQALAAERGASLVLSVVPENTGARALYRRLGFSEDAADAGRVHLSWRPPATEASPSLASVPA